MLVSFKSLAKNSYANSENRCAGKVKSISLRLFHFSFFFSFSFFPLLSNRGTQIKRFFRINEKRKMEIRAVFSSSFMISSFVFLSLSHYKYSFFPAFLVMKQYNTYLYLRFFKNKSYQRNKNVIFEYKPVLVIRKKLLYLYKIMSLT